MKYFNIESGDNFVVVSIDREINYSVIFNCNF